jgi:hypothetical protein
MLSLMVPLEIPRVALRLKTRRRWVAALGQGRRAIVQLDSPVPVPLAVEDGNTAGGGDCFGLDRA